MSRYEDIRDFISTALLSIEGIGRVHRTRRHTSDWENFLKRFIDSNKRINTVWLWRGGGTEDEASVQMAAGDYVLTEDRKSDTWHIEFFYGFKDDDDFGAPSEYTYQNLVDRIEDKFRFRGSVRGIFGDDPDNMVRFFAPQRVASGLFTFFGGQPLCHRAEFNIRVEYLIPLFEPQPTGEPDNGI